jgi:hypothetical protein
LAALNGATANQVYAAPEQAGKFILHVLVFEQAPSCILSEGNQEVDIRSARRIGEHRPEQFDFGDLPAPAERTSGLSAKFTRKQ